MEISETQGFFSSINVDDYKPQHFNMTISICTQPKIKKMAPWKMKDKQQVHHDVVSSYVHDEILEAFEDNDILSYHAQISNIK